MEELLFVLTKDFVSYVQVCFYFFTAAIFTLLAASISRFLITPMKFSCFSSDENHLLCFQSLDLALSFSVIHMSVNIKITSKKT